MKVDTQNQLEMLISHLRGIVGQPSILKAKEYLAHNEWGHCLMALEQDFLNDGPIPDKYDYQKIIDLCISMGIDSEDGDKWFYQNFKNLPRQYSLLIERQSYIRKNAMLFEALRLSGFHLIHLGLKASSWRSDTFS